MDHAKNDALNLATLRSWYDDFDTRWRAYTQILGRLRELVVLELTPIEFDEQEQFVARLVEKMLLKYDRDRLHKMCEWVQEQRQQAGWLAPRLNGVVEPTALQIALYWFLFVGGVWQETKNLGLSGSPALGYFNDCLNHRPPPDPNELHVLLSEEHTIARRVLKGIALPPVEHAGTSAEKQSRLRDDSPTPEEIDAIRVIVDEMSTKQFPDRVAIRKAMKEKSIKIGNPKLTKIFDLLRNNPKK